MRAVHRVYEEQFPLNTTDMMEVSRQQYENLEVVINRDAIEMSRQQYEKLAVAINMGTNLPSCATPNGER